MGCSRRRIGDLSLTKLFLGGEAMIGTRYAVVLAAQDRECRRYLGPLPFP